MSDDHLRLLGEGLDRLDRGAVHRSLGHLMLGTPGKVTDTLIEYVGDVRRFSHGHGLFELRGRRAFAYAHPLDFGDEDDLADEYHDYLADLVGVANADLRKQVQEALESAHRDGLTVNQSADRLGKILSGFGRGRLRTIVRTEGTRVASNTRQKIAERALEAGYGPSHMRWSAILDERVTHTCECAHGHIREVGHLDSRLSLPAHYSCRSMETFVYPEELDAGGWTPWTESEIERFTDIRRREFPSWH